MEETSGVTAKKSRSSQKVKKGFLIALAVILCIILLSSVILIFEAFLFGDRIPGNFVIKPAAENLENMAPTIKKGDFIILVSIGDRTLEEGDVVSYYVPQKGFVLGRILSSDGEKYAVGGDAETASMLVSRDDMRGLWKGFRIPLLGWIYIWCQTVWGFIIALVLIIAIDIVVSLVMRNNAKKNGHGDESAVGLGLIGMLVANAIMSGGSKNSKGTKGAGGNGQQS